MPLAVSAPVDWLPEVALVPDQLPEAVHAVALVDDQASVEDAPLTTEVGLAVSDTVGNRWLRPFPRSAPFADALLLSPPS